MAKILNLFLNLFLYFVLIKNTLANDLYFAGFAFIGNANQYDRYPVANKLFSEDKVILSKKVKESLKYLNRKDLNIIYDEGTIKSGNAKAIAFGLMDEGVERVINKLGVTSHYKIFGQVLIFDYIENKVISNFPVLSRFTIVTENIPNKEKDYEIFKSLYLDLDREASIFSQWARMLEKVKIEENSNRIYLGVENIDFDEGVKEQLPARLLKNNILKTRTAQKLEYNIAYQYGIPLVPYTVGVAIGAKGDVGLMTRFSDSVSKELKLPEIDYSINLLIRQFRKKKIENEFYENFMYAAFLKIDFKETFENTKIFEEKFYWVEDITFAKTLDYKILDEWQIYETVQANLINKTVRVLYNHEKDFISEITQRDPEKIKKKIIKIKEVLEKIK